MKRLKIFDFDGTLARTPLKPKNWVGGWWGRKESLLPPHLPLSKNIKEEMPNFIDPKIHEEYMKAIGEPDTLAVFMTGRHAGLKWIVLELLAAFGIDPEGCEKRRAYFVSGKGDTLQIKLANIEKLVLEFPDVVEIEMWEDRNEHVIEFRKFNEHLKKIRPNISLWVHEPPNWD